MDSVIHEGNIKKYPLYNLILFSLDGVFITRNKTDHKSARLIGF